MGLFENTEALGRLNDLIKIGEVSSIDPAKGTARVVFDDDDSIVSYDLPVLQRNTLLSKDFHSPDIGEDVLCLFLPSGPEEGFVIGSFYAGEVSPPEQTEKRRTTVFEDGTVVQYDKESHTLTILIEGTSVVFDRQNGTVTVPKNWTINAGDNTVVNAGTSTTVNTKTAAIHASNSMTIDSPSTHVTGTLKVDKLITGSGGLSVTGGSGASIQCSGNMELKGTINSTGDVTAGGVSLQNHTHTGVHGETSSAH